MKIKSLEVYTKASNEVRDFEEKNKEIFAEYKALKDKVSEAEEVLKTDVKENYKDTIANDFFRVGYSLPKKRGYKADVILAEVTPKQKKELLDFGAIVVSENVDDKKIVEAIESGLISKELCEKAFEEVDQAPRVTITLKK